MTDATTAGTAGPPSVGAVDDFDDVLAAAQAGAEWAMTALFRHFNPPLVRYLRAADPQAFEDLAAEVWMSVAPTLARFKGVEAEFRGWLFTIARNRLIDHGRRAARRPTSPLGEEHLADTVVMADPAEEVTERLSAQAAVDQLVSDLPAPQSEVVLLRVVAGLDAAEVAGIMGRSPGWVRVTQHRALQRLAGQSRHQQRGES